MLDLDAYLTRLGLSGRPSIAEVHRAHVAAIPFENLDPHRGVPVSLAVEDLQRKLVTERRGGYCFEQNMLLRAALQAMGAEVETFLARVRYRAPPGTIRPRSHLVLRVHDENGAGWHADVGFGLGTLLEPLPFGPGEAHEQSGWQFRIVQDGPELVLQTIEDGEWVDVYGFVPEPSPQVDLEVSNWWVCTHPHSPFVTGLVAGAQSEDGVRTTLSDWDELALTVHTPAGRTVTPVTRDDVPQLLAERFALGGYTLEEDGRVVPSPDGGVRVAGRATRPAGPAPGAMPAARPAA